MKDKITVKYRGVPITLIRNESTWDYELWIDKFKLAGMGFQSVEGAQRDARRRIDGLLKEEK